MFITGEPLTFQVSLETLSSPQSLEALCGHSRSNDVGHPVRFYAHLALNGVDEDAALPLEKQFLGF